MHSLRALGLIAFCFGAILGGCVVKERELCKDKFEPKNASCSLQYCEKHTSDPACIDFIKGLVDAGLLDAGHLGNGNVGSDASTEGDGSLGEDADTSVKPSTCSGNADCKLLTSPVCESGACTQCKGDQECAWRADAPVCQGGACVACSAENDKLCVDQGLLCKTGSSECVACNGASDCNDPKNSACNAESKCEPCATSADCAHLSDTPVCHAQQCVACTPDSRERCGNNVCDMVSEEVPVCAEGKPPRSVTACQACVSDEQCQEGQLCVRMEWQGEEVGHFCLWKQSTTAPLRICGAQLPPYFVSATASGTDGGEAATVCKPSQTTCPSIAAHRQSCGRYGVGENAIIVSDISDPLLPSEPPVTAGEIAPDPSVCGHASSALCKPRTEGGSTDPNGAYVCTTPCELDKDCRSGYTCKGATTENPGYCSF